MKNVQIIEKLSGYIASFLASTNSFEKVTLIHDYFEFIKTNPTTFRLLKDLIKRSEKNALTIFEKKEFENITLGELGYKNGRYGQEDFVWIVFALYLLIYQKMKAYKTAGSKDRKEIEDFISQEVTRPDLLQLTQVFFILIHQYILTLLNKEVFINEEASKIFFDEGKSLLSFYGQQILISKNQKKTVGHFVLKYIMINNKEDVGQRFPFKEIHESEYDEEYKPTRYVTACNDINEKIRANTPNKIEDFLEFGSGKRSEVWINKKYLRDIK